MSLDHVADALIESKRPEGRTSELSPTRRALVIKLAPVAPPCFSDRLTWLEYLCDAQIAATGNTRHGPLDLRVEPARFNFRLDFCSDCTGKFARQMQVLGRCKPDHLLMQEGSRDE